jgi:predicted O-linked N-acetylglucosamine transferase (SPINDLY family)
VEECIADDLEAYAQRAVRFARDRAFRDAVRAKIMAASDVFYDNPAPLRQFAKWLKACPLPVIAAERRIAG